MQDVFQYGEECTTVSPNLAKRIGLNEAIIIQKLNDLINKNKHDDKYFKDGSIWIKQSVATLCEKYFPYMSLSTLKRAISKLKKLNLIKIKRFDSKEAKNNTNWYSLNYEAIENIISKEDEHIELEESVVLRKGQNEPIIDEVLIRELEEIIL